MTHWQEFMTPDEEAIVAQSHMEILAAQKAMAKIKRRCKRRQKRFERKEQSG